MDAVKLGHFLSSFSQGPAQSLAGHIKVSDHEHREVGRTTGAGGAPDLSRAAGAPGQLLNREILRGLETALPDAVPVAGRRDGDLEPADIARQVLGFIQRVVERDGANDSGRPALIERARAGVEQGLREARDVLQGLGALDDELEERIAETAGLIEQGLERLAAGDEALVSDAPEAVGAGTRTALASASFSTRESTELVIDTRDGDRVSVFIDKAASASRSGFVSQSGDATAAGLESARTASVSFSFRVEGELDDEEREAIESLISRVDKVSEQFFAGNVQAAFNKVSTLGFDSEELAGFSLDLTQVQRFEALNAYRETAPASGAQGGLADIAAYGRDLRSLFQGVPPGALARPAHAAADIFQQLVGERADASFHDLRDEALSTLKGLVGAIVGELEPEHENAAADDGEATDDDSARED